MDDSIEWKEAKGGQSYSDSEHEQMDADEDDIDTAHRNASSRPVERDPDQDYDRLEPTATSLRQRDSNNTGGTGGSQMGRMFSHQRINLCLRRNITALADSNLHKAKTTYDSGNQTQLFDSWTENALIAISPNADTIIFAGQSPERVTFIAKLRMGPVNQYTTKQLEIPLDYDEQVTSLLCLPIMSTQKTAFGLVDWTALVIGLSSGYVKFYTEQSICLLSLKFCDEPVVSLKCQTQKINSNARSETHFAIISDEILIVHRTLAIVIDGIGLYENLRLSKEEVVRNGSNYEPAYNLTNLPSILNCQKWKIEDSRGGSILDAELLGTRRATAFDSLLSDSVDFEHVPTKTCARTLAFVGRNPFLSCYRESKDSSSHSYTEIIGSIFSLWNKPPPTRAQISEISRSSNVFLFDKGRLATSIVSSPDKRLAAVTDDFGRVLLVDVTNWLVTRVWKGYRSAQCGWIEVKRNPEERVCPHASFLVIYAPKRGLLEIWSAQRGPRVAAFNVGKTCRLLYSGYKMFNMRADPSQKNSNQVNHMAENSYSSHCYLLNARSENVFSIELPYTYSLYKYGDLKSRDHLLIGELIGAIQQNSEVEVISEILHRIALAESLQSSIQKLAFGLAPDKIIPIMENLINKIMKNYDNHSGETMTDDDMSIIELCKRLIRLCAIFKDLCKSTPHELPLPDVNQRLIEQYEEHPQEIDEFSEQLGWSTSEVLRYLSLLSLERSYREDHLSNPWPSLGEPLAWNEFISCFNLARIDNRFQSSRSKTNRPDKMSIALLEFNSKFLIEDKVVKTALFMYNRLSEAYYKSSQSSKKQSIEEATQIASSYNFLEPSSRLALLFQFWLSTKLCNHWKMWDFLQNQVGQISDELKVIAMSQEDDKILIETWKQIYNLILESDNIYAAIIATAAIKSDTIRMIQDNEKREKLESDRDSGGNMKGAEERERRSSIDWECLCIDAERMSIVSQQLEDVFLLNLLLRYSPNDGHLVDSYLYKLPRISVANILRGGPTIVSELVAQWAIQSEVSLRIFTQPYGSMPTEGELVIAGPDTHYQLQHRSRLLLSRSKQQHLDNEEHAKELLHHTKTSYPRSLEPDVVLLNCVWELCRRWTNNPATDGKVQLLRRAYDCLPLLNCVELRHKLATITYKTFFQRTFERLVALVETNSTILNVKNSKIRGALTWKELNMGEECLDGFVQFCCDLSEFMLETCDVTGQSNSDKDLETKSRLMELDNWWTTANTAKMLDQASSIAAAVTVRQDHIRSSSIGSGVDGASNSLVKTTLLVSNLLSIDTLVELNRLANLVNLIFKLKIVKAYPMSLIGEESRQTLKIDIQQSPTPIGAAADMKNRSGSLNDLRQKFVRKCILNIVCKMTEETNEFNEDEYRDDVDAKQSSPSPMKQGGNVLSSPKTVAKPLRDYDRKTSNNDLLDDIDEALMKDENNESMVLFATLLSLANEWQLNRDEIYLEFVFELYRCNHDKIASQISNRVRDQPTLANGLLKIASQRVLVLFGLSPHVSGSEWRRRSDKWSIFQPNVASWLKSIQQEEMKREIAPLSFTDSVKPNSDTVDIMNNFGVQVFVLHLLRSRTKVVLESVTNHLDGQAGRLAYDLLQLLESQLFDKLLTENKLSAEREEHNQGVE